VAAAVATDARVPEDVGFEGDPSSEDGQDVEAEARGLIAYIAVGTGAGADTGASCGMMGSPPSMVDGIVP
jgi:hypothetical protein